MLTMMLLLAIPPQAGVPAPTIRSVTIDRTVVEGGAPLPYASEPGVIGLTPDHCRTAPILTVLPRSAAGNLLWREGGEPVAHYRLLERRVNGCPAPIIVNYRVPGSNAIGREASAPGRGDRLPVP